ncbi:MAG: flagellar basal-body MS-ring/collar protein FliF [Opitutaceae bacterium]|nr:flagellar basal-body MS-ring/collar protein FliF [Opitutaceae bacterium]
MKAFAQSLLALWKQLGLNQRVSLVLAGAVVLAGFVALVLWSRRPDYVLLYGRLGDKDASAIISQLQSQNIPHQIAAGGGAVYVPADQVYRLRMDLAAKGLPTGDGVGFEIFDKGQFGLSDFVQRTNYLRALQGELSRTIAQLRGVRSARVMIVQPENRLLLTDQGVKPTASVFVELAGGRLATEAVNAIRNLVASSVQGLLPDQVAVVDNQGRVLSADLKEDPLLSSAAGQMRYREQVEDYFAKKVQSMLADVIGPGNAVVRVSAEIETDATTLTEEKYDPEGQVVRSQTNTEDTTNTTETRTGGVVGVTANVPDKAPAADTAKPTSINEQTRKNRTTTYEINRTTTNIVRNPGAIKSLTAAVFIAQRPPGANGQAAPRTSQELDALRQIVVNALGLRATAGQSLAGLVSLQEASFQAAPIAAQVEQIEQETRVAAWMEGASRYVALALALAVLAVFWRLLRRQKPEPLPVELLSEAAASGPRSRSLPGTITPELLNELIRQKPANIGVALRDWAAVKKN